MSSWIIGRVLNWILNCIFFHNITITEFQNNFNSVITIGKNNWLKWGKTVVSKSDYVVNKKKIVVSLLTPTEKNLPVSYKSIIILPCLKHEACSCTAKQIRTCQSFRCSNDLLVTTWHVNTATSPFYNRLSTYCRRTTWK